MSWSVVFDDLSINQIPDNIWQEVGKDNPLYRQDLEIAFNAALKAGLVSATLMGGRTPSPYGGADTVLISIHGFDSYAIGEAVVKRGHDDQVRDNILAGPDE